jgi:hypothetical protein
MATKKTVKKTTRKVIKSADDGKFKSKEFAKKHPKTTLLESVKAPERKKTKASGG